MSHILALWRLLALEKAKIKSRNKQVWLNYCVTTTFSKVVVWLIKQFALSKCRLESGEDENFEFSREELISVDNFP